MYSVRILCPNGRRKVQIEELKRTSTNVSFTPISQGNFKESRKVPSPMLLHKESCFCGYVSLRIRLLPRHIEEATGQNKMHASLGMHSIAGSSFSKASNSTTTCPSRVTRGDWLRQWMSFNLSFGCVLVISGIRKPGEPDIFSLERLFLSSCHRAAPCH